MRFFACALVLFLNACVLNRIPGDLKAASKPSVPDTGLAGRLQSHVEKLAKEIGPRSYRSPLGLEAAAAFIEKEFRSFAAEPTVSVRVLPYKIAAMPTERLHRCVEVSCQAPNAERPPKPETLEYRNLELEIRGREQPHEIVVVGAHYDSDSCESGGCNPGADDNASGVAALLELARMFRDRPLARTVRFVAFTNEEEPFFHTSAMGSLVYAQNSLRPGEKVVAMYSLETMGFYVDKPDSQDVPWILDVLFNMPTVGNFIAFVGNWDSEELVQKSIRSFERAVSFPAEGVVTYAWVEGVDWSDHWAYWEADVPAVMVTDTAPNRNKCYHKPCDTADSLDYSRFSIVVEGIFAVLNDAAGTQ